MTTTLNLETVIMQVEGFQQRLLEAHARIAPILDRVHELERDILRLADLTDGVLLTLDTLQDADCGIGGCVREAGHLGPHLDRTGA